MTSGEFVSKVYCSGMKHFITFGSSSPPSDPPPSNPSSLSSMFNVDQAVACPVMRGHGAHSPPAAGHPASGTGTVIHNTLDGNGMVSRMRCYLDKQSVIMAVTL